MTAEVHAWARERLAEALYGDLSDCDLFVRTLAHNRADAVLAVLPELLTDERVVQAAERANRGSYRTRATLTTAAEALAGAS